MRRQRERRAKVELTLRDQPPPLDSRFAGRALVRQVGEQSTAGAPQAGQSGCHRLRGDGHIRRGAAGSSTNINRHLWKLVDGRSSDSLASQASCGCWRLHASGEAYHTYTCEGSEIK